MGSPAGVKEMSSICGSRPVSSSLSGVAGEAGAAGAPAAPGGRGMELAMRALRDVSPSDRDPADLPKRAQPVTRIDDERAHITTHAERSAWFWWRFALVLPSKRCIVERNPVLIVPHAATDVKHDDAHKMITHPRGRMQQGNFEGDFWQGSFVSVPSV